MSPKTLLIATAALASAAAAQPALAAGGPPDGEPPLRAAIMFNLLDRNADGVVDKDEAAAVTTAIFTALDADGNGSLSQQELGAVRERVAMHMGRGPGFHGPRDRAKGPEAGPGPRRDFSSFDTNGDGTISQDEFESASPLMLGPRR